VTATILPDRPVERVPADSPVLVVIDLDHPAATPDPAVLAAATAGRPVTLVALASRVGISTDAAVLAAARRRVREEAERMTRIMRRPLPPLSGPADLVWYARTPLGRPVEQARRAAHRAARRHGARAVVLPAHLEA